MNPRGRPSTGIRVDIRIPADQLAVIDKMAAEEDVTRAEIIRSFVQDGLRYLLPEAV